MTIEQKGTWFTVRDSKGKQVYHGKNEAKANSIYQGRSAREVKHETLSEKIMYGHGRWY